MSTRQLVQTAPAKLSFTPVRSGLLQRKCACGGTPGLSGDCEECSRKRLNVQRRAPPGLQTKLAINQPGDRFEQEADRMAEFVVNGSDATGPSALSPLTSASIRRYEKTPPPKPNEPLNPLARPGLGVKTTGEAPERKKKKEQLMRREADTARTPDVIPPIVDETLLQSGEPLDRAMRIFMESRFGHDFTQVRVHADAQAADSARAVNALAYTVGRNIVFGAGQYVPGSATAQRLIAHELAHVVQQQRQPSTAKVQREELPDDPYPATEDGEQPSLFSLSDNGFDFIARHEGVRLSLYNDSAGHCTIGVGHLVHKGNCDGTEPEKFTKGLTKDEAMDLFRNDLQTYEAAVANSVMSRLNQHYFDALVSFTFNVGIGAFQSSGVLKQMNSKNYSKVPSEMMKWVKPPEIKGRRTDEANLFRTGNYGP